MTSTNQIQRQYYTDRYRGVEAHSHSTQYSDYESELGMISLDNNGDAYSQNQVSSGPRASDESLMSGLDDDLLENSSNAAIQMMGGGENSEAPAKTPKQQLSDLKKLLQNPDNARALGDDAKEELLDKVHVVEKLIGKKSTNPDDLQGQIENLKEEVSSSIESANSNRQEKISALKSAVTSLTDKVSHSKLTADQKSQFTDTLTGLKNDLKNENVSVDDTQTAFEALDKDLTKEIAKHDMAKKFDDVPSRIPSKGWYWEKSVELSRRVRDAVKSGDWSSVDSFLTDLRDNHNDQANNAVQQFVGALYYGPAGKDEAKLDQLLSLIPSSTRDLMASAAVANDGEKLSSENIDTETNKESFMYYATPLATSDRLKDDDIDSAFDDLGTNSTNSSIN